MKANHSNAVREAKSHEELSDVVKGGRSVYGMYSEIFDRQIESVDRYLERGWQLPSVKWTKEFVQAGGSFDSCGSWGITPKHGIELDGLDIPAEFAGRMLALLGRADYDYHWMPSIYKGGFNPKKRSEYHACVSGIYRQGLAQKAKAGKRSTMRLGWMKEEEFVRYIFKTSTMVASSTKYYCFNGISLENDKDEDFLKNKEFLKNPVFAKWVSKRPSEGEIARRKDNFSNNGRTLGWENIPSRLRAAAIRANRSYCWSFNFSQHTTSVGTVLDLGDNILISYPRWDATSEARTYFGRKVGENLLATKIANMYFVWNPRDGFQKHMENPSLREAIRMWNNRSKKGYPRPLCLNEIRNDRTGTAGFCLTGTKTFLQHRMPFVYFLIRKYSNWNQIPEEIMSTVWDIDFKVFKGYPVP